MEKSTWNRSARYSGGQKPVKIQCPLLTPQELLVSYQRERIRAKFGERGVQLFDNSLKEEDEYESTGSSTQ